MNDQASKLRHSLSDRGNKAKNIAIISGKGGVGKSNTAINFSIELQKLGKKVLIFDLDIGMGNIDILLGKDAKHTIVDLFNNYMPIHDIIELGPKGLSYVAGGSSLSELMQFDAYKMNYFFEQYELLAKKYDYILFDMGAGATETSLAFILASDECLVVTTPEPTAITDAYSMMKQVQMRTPGMPFSIIMNRCDNAKEGKMALDRFEQVISQFMNIQIKKLGVLPYDKIVHTSVIRQKPYTLLNKNAKISKALNEIAVSYAEDKPITSKQSSFTDRLKNLLGVRG